MMLAGTRTTYLIHCKWRQTYGTLHASCLRKQKFSSSKSAATQASSGGGSNSTTRITLDRVKQFVFQPRFRLLARAVKYVRIPVLVLSIYGLGYQQGIVDYSRDPQKKRGALLDTILAGVAVTTSRDDDKVDSITVHNQKITSRFQIVASPNETTAAALRPTTRRVATVGSQIVVVAQNYVKSKLQEAAKATKEKLPSDISPEQLYHELTTDEAVVFWDDALRRLEGPWTFFVLDTQVPNAFVSEILPQHLFITTSMMHHFIENNDELALVLGHEVSHLILGHVSAQNYLQTLLRTVEVLLLSLDPTEGLISMAIIGLLATVRTALLAAHSRENETEADELGIKLAAMACFDTQRASHVFYKMHLHSQEGKQSSSLLTFLDSHPPSVERHEQLILQSEEENIEKYQDTSCASIATKLKGLLQSQDS